MPRTTSANVIIPEVLADMISAQIPGKLALAGTDAVVTLNNLQGKPGDTVKIPRWEAIGEFEQLEEGTPMTPVNLAANSITTTIKEFGKAVEITERALLSSYSDPIKELADQFAKYFARAVDRELVKTATTGVPASNIHSINTTINLDAVVEAKFKWADEQDDAYGLVVHPKVAADLLKLPEFKANSQLASDIIVKGSVGQLYGMPVFISRAIPQVSGKYRNLLLKRKALGLWYKKELEVKTDEDIYGRVIAIAANTYFATGVFPVDPYPVVILETT